MSGYVPSSASVSASSRTFHLSLLVIISLLVTWVFPHSMLLAQESEWQIEIVDSDGSVGQYASMDLCSDGLPHIAYRDEDQGNLKYTWRDGAGWHFENPDTISDSGWFTSIALDSFNHAHFIHMVSSGALAYAFKGENGWSWELVDTDGDHCSMTSLAPGMDGSVHMAYCFRQFDDCMSYGELKYASRNQANWDIATIAQETAGQLYPSLVVDSSAHVHMAYARSQTGILKYAYMEGSAWNTEIVHPSNAWNVSLVLDSENRPHIAYRCRYYPDYLIKYARRVEAEWHIQTVAVSDAQSVSLQLDSDDRPHIAYCKYRTTNDEYELCYARNIADWWQIETIDNQGSVGQYASMVLDEQDLAHIVYYDVTNSNLKYAHAGELSSDQATNPAVSTIQLQLRSQNPSHGIVKLGLQLPAACDLLISVHDISGRQLYTIADRPFPEGKHMLHWNVHNDTHCSVRSGTYIISAEAGGQRVSERIVLLR